jgi:hypothetical protein
LSICTAVNLDINGGKILNFIGDTGAAVAEENLFAGENGLGAATNEVQNLATIDIQINGAAVAQRCFVGSAGNSNVRGTEPLRTSGVVADWFTNGVWDICEGENDTCEIKVVRRNEVIQQIHSKCANRHSCVDNMRQNFNPEGGRVTPQGNGFIFSTWLQQACRPRWSTLYGADKWNARQMSRDSVCFFCVEPCRTKSVWEGSALTANAMRQAECVGRSAVDVWNAAPIPDSSMKIFDDCSDENDDTQGTADASFSGCARTIASDFGQTVWDSNAPKQNSDMSGPDMKKLNFYSVLDDIMLYNTEKETNHKMSLMQDVSQIQYAQILARDTLDFMTDAVDPNNAAVYEICADDYCYSDDEKVGASNAERANLGNLFSGVYSRTSTASADDFIIDIDFESPKTFDKLEFNKVEGSEGAGNYANLYKNTCLVLTKDDGTTTTPLCTDEAYGFNGSDDDVSAPIVFDPANVSNVVKVQLIFDTSTATGSDTDGTNDAINALDYASVGAIQIDTLTLTYT